MSTDGQLNHLQERLRSLFIAFGSYVLRIYLWTISRLYVDKVRDDSVYWLPGLLGIAYTNSHCAGPYGLAKSAADLRSDDWTGRLVTIQVRVNNEHWANADYMCVEKLIKHKPLIPHV